jgi:[ribosomal protein S5]-alanine N-acetyltransferase
MSPTRQPELTTERLHLRPLGPDDAPEVQRYGGAWEIADVTLAVPHPYEDGVAEEWIAGHAAAFGRGELAVFGIARISERRILGVIDLRIDREQRRAEMGYWIGLPFWGKGYCTEAARALLDYGFRELDLNRIAADHLARNPASGRVMRKIGMTREGRLREHARKWDRFEDVVVYGILRKEWAAQLA